MSPKLGTGISTKNSFDVLDLESSPVKKKAGLDNDLASVKEAYMKTKHCPTSAGISASCQSPKENMETDDFKQSNIEGRNRIPSLDRKLSRGNIKLSNSSAQSKDKTGKSSSNH